MTEFARTFAACPSQRRLATAISLPRRLHTKPRPRTVTLAWPGIQGSAGVRKRSSWRIARVRAAALRAPPLVAAHALIRVALGLSTPAMGKGGTSMVADTGVRRQRSCGRLSGAEVVAAVAAGVVAAGLAGASAASAATVVTHSAKSGEFKGGRLVLHGVSGRVTYLISSGRSGTVSVRRLHRRLFLPGARATGTLHVAGMRGGDERTFRLTKPRYSRARRTVSYRAKPLDSKPLASRAARASSFQVPRTFGAASLSIMGHPRLTGGNNGGNDCEMNVANLTEGFPTHTARGNPIQLVSSQQWDTDDWAPAPPTSILMVNGGADFLSEGGFWRGCEQSTVWHFVPLCIVKEGCGPDGTFTFRVEWPWGPKAPTYSCTSSNPAYKCQDMTASGTINWWLVPA